MPDVPVIGSGLFTYEYCVRNADKLQEVYELLADNYSRKVFASIINFKISGDISHLENITATKTEIYRDIIKPNLNEHYVDLGAYNGDTILEMLEITRNRYVRIYAMEPDRKNFKKLCKNIEGKIIFTHTITLPGVLILSFRSVQNQGDSLQLLLAEEQNILRVGR